MQNNLSDEQNLFDLNKNQSTSNQNISKPKYQNILNFNNISEFPILNNFLDFKNNENFSGSNNLESSYDINYTENLSLNYYENSLKNDCDKNSFKPNHNQESSGSSDESSSDSDTTESSSDSSSYESLSSSDKSYNSSSSSNNTSSVCSKNNQNLIESNHSQNSSKSSISQESFNLCIDENFCDSKLSESSLGSNNYDKAYSLNNFENFLDLSSKTLFDPNSNKINDLSKGTVDRLTGKKYVNSILNEDENNNQVINKQPKKTNFLNFNEADSLFEIKSEDLFKENVDISFENENDVSKNLDIYDLNQDLNFDFDDNSKDDLFEKNDSSEEEISESVCSDSYDNIEKDTLKDFYKIEKIVSKRYDKRGNFEYLVKYENLDEDQLVWEKEKKIDSKLILEFNDKYGDKLLLKNSELETNLDYFDKRIDNSSINREGINFEELIRLSISSPLTNIFKNLKPERIIGIYCFERKYYFLIKYQKLARADLVKCKEFRENYPKLVCEFLEKKILFGNLKVESSSVPKEKYLAHIFD